ncbi:hypothetical protein KI387_044246 [Taxus chinensis]|uniref:Uncharacterized protein n=1 Tax=Taxus chinensis TaxID=29808 RepID=A0AA38FCX0_TAXCH|nr:hypothetical protein KI387_044246 [Taxus chinensis]
MFLNDKGLHRVRTGPDSELNNVVEKIIWFSRCDEVFNVIGLKVAPKLIFHVKEMDTSREAWANFDQHFGKTDAIIDHQLEKELSSFNPQYFDTIHIFFLSFSCLGLNIRIFKYTRTGT